MTESFDAVYYAEPVPSSLESRTLLVAFRVGCFVVGQDTDLLVHHRHVSSTRSGISDADNRDLNPLSFFGCSQRVNPGLRFLEDSIVLTGNRTPEEGPNGFTELAEYRARLTEIHKGKSAD